jgi:hypothetical protein
MMITGDTKFSEGASSWLEKRAADASHVNRSILCG